MGERMASNHVYGVTEGEFDFYKMEMEKRLREMELARRKTTDCHARRILDVEDRTVFIGRFMCVGLFLSVVAVVMAVLF